MSTRVAVVDLGSNSTRLLVADLHDDGTITERERRSVVTRLGAGVDAAGRLDDAAMERVYATLAEYRAIIDAERADHAVGVLTSAVRDASNGPAFTARVRDAFGIAAMTIPGEVEAQLTYLGATSERRSTRPTAVIDIGGGSTEIVVGAGAELLFHVSTQVGVVRHSERRLHDDPPRPKQLEALREDARSVFAVHVAPPRPAEAAVAVAGTATQCAAMLGTGTLERGELERLLDRLASVPLEERRRTPGLDPERAPTIIAGVAILLEALASVGLREAEASDNDILRGAALRHSAFLGPHPQFSG